MPEKLVDKATLHYEYLSPVAKFAESGSLVSSMFSSSFRSFIRQSPLGSDENCNSARKTIYDL